jgi:hypothetical protein
LKIGSPKKEREFSEELEDALAYTVIKGPVIDLYR